MTGDYSVSPLFSFLFSLFSFSFFNSQITSLQQISGAKKPEKDVAVSSWEKDGFAQPL